MNRRTALKIWRHLDHSRCCRLPNLIELPTSKELPLQTISKSSISARDTIEETRQVESISSRFIPAI
jgi:hypothetical protein